MTTRLTKLEFHHKDKWNNSYSIYKCLCGTVKVISDSNVRRCHTRSCGCLNKEVLKKRSLIHSHKINRTATPEYRCWVNMKNRCYYSNHEKYEYYGGRGITVCARWRKSFKNFIQDMRLKPTSKHSIDRIDPNGNYEPSNCRWATNKEQQNNKR